MVTSLPCVGLLSATETSVKLIPKVAKAKINDKIKANNPVFFITHMLQFLLTDIKIACRPKATGFVIIILLVCVIVKVSLNENYRCTLVSRTGGEVAK